MRPSPIVDNVTSPRQFRSVDLLKIVAVQLIVLHHLAFYGPMSDQVELVAPALIAWLDDYARIAVQVFLVTGGFLAARSLSPAGTPGIARPWHTIGRRYLKLVPPFLAATLLAVAASALASLWMTHASISAPPTIRQLAAHALLLHGVLGYASLSAGAWYVAIDFQLYALMTLLLWMSGGLAARRPAPWLLPGLVVALATLSLLVVNRDAAWDDWAPYFFGSYGLGAIAWWARDLRRSPATARLLLGAILLPAVIALMLDFRSRIALAVVLACALVVINRSAIGLALNQDRRLDWIDRLGKMSYSVFLIHFPVCLVVNAWFYHFAPAAPLWQGVGMLTAWIGSLLAGALFHRWIELPLGQLSAFGQRRVGIAPAIR
ncbi:acyltransferase [Actimicrobium sp. CCC2.4]|uniref:acyltransferase family protein n=1 Tax=Actimicrobium sp. CCC2.4 TaxID=3048606 RepID=UPI002AC8EAC4|nr:acyltransferase [Actimicrobium sp. CCC2.4]MEB0135961.1 acyltransferase [Actimicrobium sp. CCC2.4]WPX32625.1 acyltransferase [Actimicrobium sp. CCC2.4]